MTTQREIMLAALKTRIETLIAAVPELKVYRNRSAAMKDAPALNVIDGGHSVETEQTEFKMFYLGATISGLVTADSDEQLGAAANELYGRVIDALEADTSLGVDASDVIERNLEFELESEDAKKPTAWFHLGVEIQFTTARVNASQP